MFSRRGTNAKLGWTNASPRIPARASFPRTTSRGLPPTPTSLPVRARLHDVRKNAGRRVTMGRHTVRQGGGSKDMPVTNAQSGTNVHEIAPGIFRISTPVPPSAMPGGFTFNQFLVV